MQSADLVGSSLIPNLLFNKQNNVNSHSNRSSISESTYIMWRQIPGPIYEIKLQNNKPVNLGKRVNFRFFLNLPFHILLYVETYFRASTKGYHNFCNRPNKMPLQPTCRRLFSLCLYYDSRAVGHNQRQSLADIQNQREYPTAEEFEFWEHLAN